VCVCVHVWLEVGQQGYLVLVLPQRAEVTSLQSSNTSARTQADSKGPSHSLTAGFVTLHHNVLHCVLHCVTLLHTALHCITMCYTVCYTVSHCFTLHYTASHRHPAFIAELAQQLAARDQELLKVQSEVESAHTSAAGEWSLSCVVTLVWNFESLNPCM